MNQQQLKKEIEKLIKRNRWEYSESYQNNMRSLVGKKGLPSASGGDKTITIPLMDSRSQTTDNF